MAQGKTHNYVWLFWRGISFWVFSVQITSVPWCAESVSKFIGINLCRESMNLVPFRGGILIWWLPVWWYCWIEFIEFENKVKKHSYFEWECYLRGIVGKIKIRKIVSFLGPFNTALQSLFLPTTSPNPVHHKFTCSSTIKPQAEKLY